MDWSGSELQADGSLLGLAKLSGGGAFDLERADLAFAVEVDELGGLAGFAPEGAPEIRGSAAGELRIAGPLTAPEVALRLDRLETMVGGTPLVARRPVRLRLAGLDRGGRLYFDSLYVGAPEGESEVVAAGSVGLTADAPLDLRLQGAIENAWLKPILPGFELSGSSDVLATVRGTPEAPKINGQASLQPGVQLTSAALPEPITDVRGVALFYPDRLVVDRFQGEMGGGTLQATGTLEWPRPDEPTSARFQVALRAVTMRYPEGWLSRGDADLVWTIEGDQQAIRGQALLDRALYLRDVDVGLVPLLQKFFRKQRQEVAVADEDLGDVQLNLQVRAPGTVRIKNNLADLKGTAELTVRGSLARPILFGRVEAEPGGRLVYADNDYRIERATLTFANPYRVEPLLDLVATTRVTSYDVRLALFGNLERLNATFSSDPPLPDLEVLSLLLSGAPGRLEDELSRLRTPQQATRRTPPPRRCCSARRRRRSPSASATSSASTPSASSRCRAAASRCRRRASPSASASRAASTSPTPTTRRPPAASASRCSGRWGRGCRCCSPRSRTRTPWTCCGSTASELRAAGAQAPCGRRRCWRSLWLRSVAQAQEPTIRAGAGRRGGGPCRRRRRW